jgi:hypothetical protein
MSSMRAWVRLEVPLAVTLEERVAEWGGVSSGSRTLGLSRALWSSKVEEEADKGVIGRGLSGEGVRGTERRGGCFGLSLR